MIQRKNNKKNKIKQNQTNVKSKIIKKIETLMK